MKITLIPSPIPMPGRFVKQCETANAIFSRWVSTLIEPARTCAAKTAVGTTGRNVNPETSRDAFSRPIHLRCFSCSHRSHMGRHNAKGVASDTCHRPASICKEVTRRGYQKLAALSRRFSFRGLSGRREILHSVKPFMSKESTGSRDAACWRQHRPCSHHIRCLEVAKQNTNRRYKR